MKRIKKPGLMLLALLAVLAIGCVAVRWWFSPARRVNALLARIRAQDDDASWICKFLHTEPQRAPRVLEIMGELVEMGPAAVDPLAKALDHHDVYIARVAAMALGAIGDRRAVSPLCRLLTRSDTSLVHDAIRALGRLGGPDAVTGFIGVCCDRSRNETFDSSVYSSPRYHQVSVPIRAIIGTR